MKGTENFKSLIEQHLERAAQLNSVFAEKYKNPKKNIDDCITYILNQVKASGSQGFEDSEVYGMAMHYYEQDDIKPGSKTQMKVVVNHQVKLSDKEIEELKEKARQQVIDEEKAKIRKKPVAKSGFKSGNKETESPTLF
jgi:hypothetical protein